MSVKVIIFSDDAAKAASAQSRLAAAGFAAEIAPVARAETPGAFASYEAVVNLDNIGGVGRAFPDKTATVETLLARGAKAAAAPAANPNLPIIGGIAAAVAVLALAGWYLFGGNGDGGAATPDRPAITIDAKAVDPNERIEGRADAPVTIIEYASLTCGHCAQFHIATKPLLQRTYIDTGLVRFVYRDFPTDGVAAAASLVAMCMGDKTSAFVDMLFRNQARWAFVERPREAIIGMAQQAGLPRERAEACLTDQAALDRIRAVAEAGRAAFNVAATPTFIINGDVLNGAQPYPAFVQAINKHLPPEKQPQPATPAPAPADPAATPAPAPATPAPNTQAPPPAGN